MGPIESYPQPSWWRTIKLHHVVLTLAGVLAAFETIENHSDRVVAAPSLALKDDSGRADVIEGESLQLKMTIVNQIRARHSDVQVAATLQSRESPPDPNKKTNALSMVVSEPRLPELTGHEKRDLVATIRAPMPGEYSAQIEVRADAGWFRPQGVVKAVKEVKVWPLQPLGTVYGLAVADTRGRLAGKIDVGPEAGHGLDCELAIKGFAGLKRMSFNTNAPQTDVGWHSSATRKHDAHVLAWTIPNLKEMQTIKFDLFLERGTATNWNDIARATKVVCGYRQKGVER